jgi:hypothetical protein
MTYVVVCGFIAPTENIAPAVPLLLRVNSLPWEPISLRSLPSNGFTRYRV